MRVKRYLEFSSYGPKQQLLSHLDENRADIENNGLDFEEVRAEVARVLDSLDDSFVAEVIERFSSIPKEGKEYKKAFENIMQDVVHELEHAAAKNESLRGFFSGIHDKISSVAKWISDRSITIIGAASLGLGALLGGSILLGHGPEMSEIVQNITINGLLGFGVTALSFGLKHDEFNQK